MKGLRIVEPGALSSVQDCGRRGCAHLGVSPSGVADWFSARAANRLVGNDECAAVIESTLSGMKFAAEAGGLIAITGAQGALQIDGGEAALWQAHEISKGAQITIAPARRGLRSYVAIAGGFDVPPMLGSASTDLGAGFGGFEGRPLRSGDTLAVTPQPKPTTTDPFPEECIPHWTSPTILRAIAGPHAKRIGPSALTQLCEHSFTVSSRSTRQGLRLEGEPLTLDGATDIPSAGACAGCVQVTSDGLPVLLLAEHQTTGGYAYALGVITADLPRAGQLRPGDIVRFELVTLVDAAHALALAMRRLHGERIDAAASLAQGFFEGA